MNLFKKTALGLALMAGMQATAGVISLDSLLNGVRDEASVRKAILEYALKYGKMVLYCGADWCKYCKSTKAAILAVLSQYPDVTFIIADTTSYPYLKNGTIPKVRFYKNGYVVPVRENGKTLQETGSLDEVRLKALLNRHYRK